MKHVINRKNKNGWKIPKQIALKPVNNTYLENFVKYIKKIYSNQVGNSNYNFYIKNSLSIFKNVEQKLFRSFRLRKNDFLNPLDVSEIYEQELMKKSCVIKEAWWNRRISLSKTTIITLASYNRLIIILRS